MTIAKNILGFLKMLFAIIFAGIIIFLIIVFIIAGAFHSVQQEKSINIVEGDTNNKIVESKGKVIKCGPADGICPKLCTGLVDRDCIFNEKSKILLENGMEIKIKESKVIECKDILTEEAKKFILIRMELNNKGGKTLSVWGDAYIRAGNAVLEMEMMLPPIGCKCTEEISEKEADYYQKLFPNTKTSIAYAFRIEDLNTIKHKELLFVLDTDTFLKGDEIVWRIESFS